MGARGEADVNDDIHVPKLLAVGDIAPSEAVVGILEELLKLAKSGHIRAIAFASVEVSRNISTGYSFEELGVEVHALVGGLERTKLRLLSLDEVG